MERMELVIVYLVTGFSSSGKGAKNLQALRMMRLIRLVRVARATRLLRYFPELMILARGMMAGASSPRIC